MNAIARKLLASFFGATLVLGFVSSSANAVQTAPPDSVGVRLPQAMPLSRAIAAVGQTSILQANSHLPAEQVLAAAKDATAWADSLGKLYYVEPKGIEIQNDNLFVPTTSIDPATAFQLNSRPGAQRVLFLDFDGHTVSGTAWNSGYGLNGADFYATPWDKDSSPSTFSDAERREIIAIWQRVSEDYAPFDINITTQDPGEAAIVRSSSSDQIFGTRQVVTNGSNPVSANCGCGGIAYVGVFDNTTSHSYYNVAFTFNGGVKSAAEAISHEAGHNLGLSHDGTSTQGYYGGHNGWAPIMGVGYYQPVAQWSKGEYPGANQTQDDLVVINSNGGTYATDDHGNTIASATPLDAGIVDFKGLIGKTNDVDMFKITSGAGTLTLAINPATVSPNLDILATLLDSAGNSLQTSNPTSVMVNENSMTGLDASISFTVPASGIYYLSLDGLGRGDLSTGYSDYGSLGYYRITGTIPGSYTVPAPVISSLSPTSGPVGTNVSVLGTNLSGASEVLFGSTAVTFTTVNSTRIDLVVPAGSTSSTIKVTTAGGQATSSSFTVTTPPTITSFTPASGPVGTLVTVNGTNFPSSLTGVVTFGGTSVTATWRSSTQLTFTVPNNAGATGHRVVVTTTDGSAISSGTFTIGPRVSSFVGAVTTTTTARLGQEVIVTGDHFTGATAVRVGTLSVAFTRVSDTEIRFTLPKNAKTGRISVVANGVTFTTTGSLTVTK